MPNPQAGEAEARELQDQVMAEHTALHEQWLGVSPVLEAKQTSHSSASLGHNVRTRGTLDTT